MEKTKTGNDVRVRLLVRIARALHAYGTPSHRLEETLGVLSTALEIEAQYLVTPTSIIASIGPESEAKTILSRVDPGETNLSKLAGLNEVISDVITGRMMPEQAIEKTAAVASSADPYPLWLRIFAFAAASGTAALLFQGGVSELLLSALLGGLVGALAVLASAAPRLASVLPAFAALIAGSVATAAAEWFSVQPFIPTLASLIVLIPGLSLTIAMNELSHGHLVSGTARMTGALVTFLQLGLGVAVGSKIAAFAGLSATVGAEPTPLEWRWLVAALAVTAIALTVIFRARMRRDLLPILIVAMAGYWSVRLFAEWLGPEIGLALAAFLVGALSNALARWRSAPAAITLLPGMLLLVPGSVGFRSLDALVRNDILSGIETGFAMVLLAVSLVTGLLLANLLVPSRRLL